MLLLQPKVFQRKRLRASTQTIQWFNLENDQPKLSAKVNCSCQDFMCFPHTTSVQCTNSLQTSLWCGTKPPFAGGYIKFWIWHDIREKNTIFGFVPTTSRESGTPKEVYQSSNELFLRVNQYKPMDTCTHMRETSCAHTPLKLCPRHTRGLVEKHTFSSGIQFVKMVSKSNTHISAKRARFPRGWALRVRKNVPTQHKTTYWSHGVRRW